MNTFKKILIAGVSIVFIIVFSGAAETKSAELEPAHPHSKVSDDENEVAGIPVKKLGAVCPQGMRIFSDACTVLGPADAVLDEGMSCVQHTYDWGQWRRYTLPWK